MRAVAHWQCLPDRLEALGSIPSSEKKKWGWGYGKGLGTSESRFKSIGEIQYGCSGVVTAGMGGRPGEGVWGKSALDKGVG